MPDRCTNPECEQHWPAGQFLESASLTVRDHPLTPQEQEITAAAIKAYKTGDPSDLDAFHRVVASYRHRNDPCSIIPVMPDE